ncbi:MAG: patatin-like phospholipase family protein, partial [Pseudomonadota bacterium]
CGLAQDDPAEAQRLLGDFWRQMSSQNVFSPFQPTWFDRIWGNHNLENSPVYNTLDAFSRMVSPYQFNPFDFNPLRDLLGGLIKPEELQAADRPRVFVSATDVLEGRLKVFTGKELGIEALIASACLPFLFQAVEIGGRHYWDGGYMGNPTLYPLIHSGESRDIIIVQINPLKREDVPVSPIAIVDRMNEISFNSTMMREARALGLINRLLAEGHLDEKNCGLRPMNLHRIAAEKEMADLTASSKLNTDWGLIEDLFNLGRETTDRWLDDNFKAIGKEATFDIGPFITHDGTA